MDYQSVRLNKGLGSIFFGLVLLLPLYVFVGSANAEDAVGGKDPDGTQTTGGTKESAGDNASVEVSGSKESLVTIEASMESLRAAMAAANFALAYDIGAELNFEWEGEPEFDFLFALAALETGSFNEAVFSLERVIAFFPDNLRARLELGRAYFATNNLTAAKKSFKYVLAQNPPENVKNNVQPFLDRIEQRMNATEGSFQGFLGMAGGVDNNINSAPDDIFITVPAGALGNTASFELPLSEESQDLTEAFSSFKGGIGYLHPFSKTSGVGIKMSVDIKDHFTTDTYDMDNFSADAVYNLSQGNNRYGIGLKFQSLFLDGVDFQYAWHTNLQWSRLLKNQWRLSSNLTVSDISYPDGKDKDVYQGVLFGSMSKLVKGINHNIGAIYGNSVTQRSIDKSNGKNYYGISYSASKQLSNEFTAYGRLFAQHGYYDSEFLFLGTGFGKTRREKLMSLASGIIWAMRKGLSSKLDVSYTDNNSNIEVYEYHKFKVEGAVTYQF